jgi:hypothetical protein
VLPGFFFHSVCVGKLDKLENSQQTPQYYLEYGELAWSEWYKNLSSMAGLLNTQSSPLALSPPARD